MPRRPARSDTHSSSTERAWRMRVRVGSPSREKVSARARAASGETRARRTRRTRESSTKGTAPAWRGATYARLFICVDDTALPRQVKGGGGDYQLFLGTRAM